MSSAQPTTRTSTVRRLLHVAPGNRDLVPATRIALAIAGPLLTLAAADRLEWTLFASFGAFTAVYARSTATRVRVREQSLMAVMLTACVGLGAALAHLAEASTDFVAATLRLAVPPVAAGLVAAFVRWRGTRPPGGMFAIFAVGAVAANGGQSPIWVATAVAAGSATWCILLAAAWHLLGEANPDARMRRDRLTSSESWREIAQTTAAGILGGAAGLASGLASPYWAQTAATVPLSAAGRRGQLDRGIHRVIGTLGGVGVTALLLWLVTDEWMLVACVIVLQLATELLVLRNYALALLCITPMALTMVHLAHPSPVGPMLVARAIETALGVACGLAVVAAGAWLSRRRSAPAAG